MLTILAENSKVGPSRRQDQVGSAKLSERDPANPHAFGQKTKRPLKNAPFRPISASGSNFNPQNTQCISRRAGLKFSPSLN